LRPLPKILKEYASLDAFCVLLVFHKMTEHLTYENIQQILL